MDLAARQRLKCRGRLKPLSGAPRPISIDGSRRSPGLASRRDPRLDLRRLIGRPANAIWREDQSLQTADEAERKRAR
jgi:hypothetical protein